MKIVIDATTTQDQFASRGIGRVTRYLVEGLLWLSEKKKRDDQFFLLLYNAVSTLDPVIQSYASRVRTVNLGKHRMSGKFDKLWWSMQFWPAIRRLVKTERPDVYFCPYFMKGFPGKSIPSIVMIYDFAFPVLKKYSTAPWYLDWIRKLQYHAALRAVTRAKKNAAISETTKKDLFKYVPKLREDQAETVYLGLSPEYVQRKPRQSILKQYLPHYVIKQGYILYYGGLEVNKNVPTLIREYGRLRELWAKQNVDSKPPYLVLAGGDFTRLDMRYPVLAEVKHTMEKLRLEDYVCFTGFYEDAHAVDLLNGARLFVHLSLYEGFGFSVLEAMQCGVPVVASNRSCYPEVLGDSAMLVDPEKEGEVADACLKVLTNTEIACTLSEKGIRHSKKFRWNKTIEHMDRILRSVGFGGSDNVIVQ